MIVDTAAPPARAFVRSLNILLKFARLYGLDHTRALTQLSLTWKELSSAVSAPGSNGVLLGISGTQLLLDGVPLETTPAERSFADLLALGGVASIHFERDMTREQFDHFVRAFAGAGTKAARAEQLKSMLAQSRQSGVRLNQIRFVPDDGTLADARVAVELTTRTLGSNSAEWQSWLNDPHKLIQLIAAASAMGGSSAPGSSQGGAGIGGGFGTGSGTGSGGGGSIGAPSEYGPAQRPVPGLRYEVAGLPEEAVIGILQLLVQLGEASKGKSASVDPAIWRQNVARLPEPARVTLGEALASVAAAAPSAKPGENILVRLAEDLAIRFALERFQRGEIRVNAVRQLLERMGREVESLRKMLHAREEKLANVGLPVESHADLLDRQFWASVPEAGKRTVLLSPEAWCIPPRNVRQFVEDLLDRGDAATAGAILQQYASCVRNSDIEARRKSATGLTQLVEVYSRVAQEAMLAAVRELGAQLAVEKGPEVQTFLSAAFVRFSQEAVARRRYPVMLQALDSFTYLEQARSSAVVGLRSRLGVENHMHEFIDEGLRASAFPAGFVDLLRRLPESSVEQLATRLALCTSHSERERLVQLAAQLGEPPINHLRQVLRGESASKAAGVVGLLSRLDPAAVGEALTALLPSWHRGLQEQALRQIAIAAAPERGRMLVNLLDAFDPLVRSMVVDEIGLSGDAAVTELLLRLAAKESEELGSGYQCVKIVEALGRLGDSSAAVLLREIVEKKHAWRRAHPAELRLAAAGALATIDSDWARSELPNAGFDAPEMSVGPRRGKTSDAAARQRRYPRIRPVRPLSAVVTSARGKFNLEVRSLNLGGGLLFGDHTLPAGADATLKIQFGLRSVTAQVTLRVVRAHNTLFEIVGMDLEERHKLRRLLVSLSAASSPSR
jgi:hypothetical protein